MERPRRTEGNKPPKRPGQEGNISQDPSTERKFPIRIVDQHNELRITTPIESPAPDGQP